MSVEDGGVIVIEREGKAIAQVRPPPNPDPEDAPERPELSMEAKQKIFADMEKIRARLPFTGDSTQMNQ